MGHARHGPGAVVWVGSTDGISGWLVIVDAGSRPGRSSRNVSAQARTSGACIARMMAADQNQYGRNYISGNGRSVSRARTTEPLRLLDTRLPVIWISRVMSKRENHDPTLVGSVDERKRKLLHECAAG